QRWGLVPTDRADWRTNSAPPVIAPFTPYLKPMRPEDILLPTPAGVYCKIGGFHIDPTQPVDKAVITHGPSDHARAGHGAVLATQETLDLMLLRYGANFAASTQAVRHGETVTLGGARVTFHPAGHVLGSAQIAVEANGLRVVASGDYKNVVDPTCVAFELVRCDVFITEATFGLPIFRHGNAEAEIAKLLRSVALFPDRAHLVGAYSLGKAQRVIALIREAGYDQPIYLHGAMEKITRYYESRGIVLGRFELARAANIDLEGLMVATLPRPGDLLCLGMDARACPCAPAPGRIAAGDFGSRRLGRSHCHHRRDRRLGYLGHARPGRGARALERDPRTASPAAGYPRLWRGGRDRWRYSKCQSRQDVMNRFAELLDRLAYEPGRNNKLRLMTDYFRSTPDPERSFPLAALTGALSFQHAKPSMIRALIAERVDPVLFELSYDYVGDLSETVALMWKPRTQAGTSLQTWDASPSACTQALEVDHGDGSQGHDELLLSSVVTALSSLGKSELPGRLARWLDRLDETGRWALLKLVTGGLRIGVSARLAKTAAAALGDKDPQEVELIWPDLRPPYVELFAWLEGRGHKPASRDAAPFRPAMLAHAIE